MSAYGHSGAVHEWTELDIEQRAEIVGYYRQLGMPWRCIAEKFHVTAESVRHLEKKSARRQKGRDAMREAELRVLARVLGMTA